MGVRAFDMESRSMTLGIETSQHVADILNRCREHQAGARWEEAEAAAGMALTWWPDDPDVLFERAAISQRRMRWADALERYDLLRRRHPSNPMAWSRTGEMLRWAERHRDANDLLVEAEQRFPLHGEVLIQWTMAACDLLEWPEAERRAGVLLNRISDSDAGYHSAADVYSRQQRFREAEALIGEGLLVLGPTPLLAVRLAQLADARKDLPAAARRWREVLRRWPDREDAYHGLARALGGLGDHEAQDEVLAEAVRRFPDSLELVMQHAWCAVFRNQADESVRRWQALLVRYPDHPGIRQALADALASAGLSSLRQIEISPAPASMNGSDDVAELMLQFESLGVNCEFGLIQRCAGAEPLNLLRFAFITGANLIAALDSDFAGVGDPEHTHVFLRDNVEYMIEDRRYGLGMHSFAGPDSIAIENFTRASYRRLGYLARKMRDDLREAAKIYVRSAGDWPLSADELARLMAALRRHNPMHTLMYVGSSDDPSRFGRAEWAAPGLIYAWVAHDRIDSLDHVNWRAACRAAHALWLAERRRTEAA